MRSKVGEKWAGLSVIGSVVTGAVGFIADLTAISNGYDENSRLCFPASVLSFGLLTNAMYRN